MHSEQKVQKNLHNIADNVGKFETTESRITEDNTILGDEKEKNVKKLKIYPSLSKSDGSDDKEEEAKLV